MSHHSDVDADAISATTESSQQVPLLNRRELATLRAVASGEAEISCSKAPDLFLDGLACCDQSTARRLATLGLVEAAHQGASGARVPAVVTETGKHVLAVTSGKVLVA